MSDNTLILLAASAGVLYYFFVMDKSAAADTSTATQEALSNDVNTDYKGNVIPDHPRVHLMPTPGPIGDTSTPPMKSATI
jgi:hypothetical protein